MNKSLRILLLLLGLGIFALLIFQAGPRKIGQDLLTLGAWLPLILVPYAITYGLDTLAWRETLGPYKRTLRSIDLYLIRIAGEAVNQMTPAAYLAGEPVKAFLLKKGKIPLSAGMASVIISMTTITLAQIAFIFLAIVMAYSRLAGAQGLLASTFVVTVLALAFVATAWWIQRKGLFGFLIRLLTWLQVPTGFLKTRESELHSIDQSIRRFYSHDRRHLAFALILNLSGWITGSFEIYFVLYFLNLPVRVSDAIALEALVTLIRSVIFFLPGALGAQEGGTVFLFYLFGLPKEAAMTCSIVRRTRELLLIGGGLSVLFKNELRPTILEEPHLPTKLTGGTEA